MDAQDIARVQTSFAAVKPIATEAAAQFYDRLFTIAPHTRALFTGDMADQGTKLMATLAIVVAVLDRLPSILPAASALAKRHVSYGVEASDYAPVGAALLWTLERNFGEAWTPELSASWAAAYGTLSGYMIGEAYGAAAAADPPA